DHLGDDRPDVAEVGHGPGRVRHRAFYRRKPDLTRTEVPLRHAAGPDDPDVPCALHAHTGRNENIDLVEARAAQPMPPDGDRPGEQAPGARVQQRRHSSLIRGHRAVGADVDAGQDPLPSATWPHQVIETAPANAALKY